MKTRIRANEEILQKLERIRDVSKNTLEKVTVLLNKYAIYQMEVSKDEMMEDIEFISKYLSTAMKLCDSSFKYYTVLPRLTEYEDLPACLSTMKSSSLVEYEKDLLNKAEFEEDQYLNDINYEKENEKKIKGQIGRLSEHLVTRLNKFRAAYQATLQKNEETLNKEAQDEFEANLLKLKDEMKFF